MFMPGDGYETLTKTIEIYAYCSLLRVNGLSDIVGM